MLEERAGAWRSTLSFALAISSISWSIIPTSSSHSTRCFPPSLPAAIAAVFQRRELLLEEDHVAVLVGPRVEEVLAVLAQLGEELLALRGELLRLRLELLRIPGGEALDDGGDRALELVAALDVALQHAHGQRPQLLDDVIAQDAQRLGGVTRDQDALALGEQMTDEVRDGVCLPGPRRPLDEHASFALQAHRDPDLLGVRRLAEQHVLGLVSRLEGLRLRVLGGRRVETDDLEQR